MKGIVREQASAKLLGALSARDLAVLKDVHVLGVMTTDQIRQLHFGEAVRRAQRRLARLCDELKVLRRFRSHPWEPMRYVLTALGAMALSDAECREVRPEPYLRFAHHTTLAHRLDVGHFYCVLKAAGALSSWQGEASLRAQRRGVRGESIPDARFIYRHAGTEVGAYLELDRGTETHAVLRTKLVAYAEEPFSSTGAEDVVCFCFTLPGREACIDLSHPRVPVATTTLDRHRADPLGPIWRPAGTMERHPLESFAGAWERKDSA
jgi:hypothetical protein